MCFSLGSEGLPGGNQQCPEQGGMVLGSAEHPTASHPHPGNTTGHDGPTVRYLKPPKEVSAGEEAHAVIQEGDALSCHHKICSQMPVKAHRV